MAKKEKKKKVKMNKGKLYDTKSEKLERKNLFCPKCGPGVFMAQHKDRNQCGRCGYTQWKTEGK